jgi:HK97 family phage portal protein
MLAGLFRPQESRAVSYQDVWGSGDTWAPDGTYGPIEALKLSAVIACIDLRAKTIGQLPISAYRPGDNGIPELVPTQPALIEAPSKLPRSQWLRQMSVSRDLWGNAFGAILGRDAAGWPTAVEWLDPAVTVVRERSTLARPEVTYNGREFPYSDLLVVPGFPMPGSAFGISPLQGSGLVELSHRAQEFGRDWFRNGAVPSTVIRSDEVLDADTAARIRDRAVAAWRKRRPAVLGSGLTVEHVKVNAEESQFLGTMRAAQAEICQVFGVPPEKIGVAPTGGSSVTYQNREQQVQQFLVDGINADLVLIQEVLGAAIPPGMFVRINTGALLRSDLAARYASYQVALDAGFLTKDEVRALEERAPIPETAESISARDLAELLQKVYLAVDVVVSADEARDLARSAGANLVGSLPAPPAPPAPTPGGPA